jgi:hypothetical protein
MMLQTRKSSKKRIGPPRTSITPRPLEHGKEAGREDLDYDLCIVTPSGATLVNTRGLAKRNNSVISLQPVVRLSSAHRIPYTLQIRKADLEWVSYATVLG